MTDVRTADGRVHHFPDGIPQEAIDKALAKYNAGMTQPPNAHTMAGDAIMNGPGKRMSQQMRADAYNAEPEDYSDVIPGGIPAAKLAELNAFDRAMLKFARFTKPMKDWTDTTANALTMGLADHAGALGGAVGRQLKGAEDTFGQSYDKELRGTDENRANFKAAHPGAYWSGEIGGSVALPAAAGAKVATKAAPFVEKVWTGIKQGVGMGATSGAAHARGEGDQGAPELGDVLTGGVTGAAAGGVVGGAVPIATGTVGKVASGIYNTAKNWFTDAAPRLMAEAAQDMTPAQIDAAQAFMREAQAAGHNVTFAEAAQQVTGGRARQLTDLQRVVEQSPGGGRLRDAMADRPAQARAGVEALTDAVRGGSKPVGEALDTLPGRLAERGQQAVGKTEKGLTQSVESHYAPVSSTRAPGPAQVDSMWNNQDQWRALLSRPGAADAFRRAQVTASNKGEQAMMFGRLDANGNLVLERMPTGPEIDRMKKALDALIEPHRNQMTGNLKSEADGLVTLQRELLALADQSLPTYSQGRFAFSEMADPVKRVAEGPLGKVAGASGTPEQMFSQQLKAILPDAPNVTDENSIRMLIRQLQGGRGTGAYRPGGGRRVLDPTTRQALSQFLTGKFDEIAQALKSSPLQQGAGAGFWAKMAGNNQQAANLRAAIEEAAGPDVARGMDNLFRVFEAQGHRQPAGSLTTFNQMIREAMEGPGISPAGAAAAVSSGGKSLVGNVVADAAKGLAQGKATKSAAQLSDLLLDPDAAALWRQLGRVDPNSRQAGALVRTLLQRLGVALPVAPNDTRRVNPDERG